MLVAVLMFAAHKTYLSVFDCDRCSLPSLLHLRKWTKHAAGAHITCFVAVCAWCHAMSSASRKQWK